MIRENAKNSTKKEILFRIALFVAAAILIAYFYPDRDKIDYDYKVGRPWTYSLLTAPFDMPVMLDSATIKAKKDSIDKAFVPVFRVNKNVENATLTKISGYYKVAFNSGDLRRLESILRSLYRDGIVDNDVYDAIQENRLPSVRVLSNNVLTTVPTTNMVSVKIAYSYIDSAMHSSPIINNIDLAKILAPNVEKDKVTSERLLNDLYRNSMAPQGMILQGQKIVDRGEIITPQTAMLLKTYETMMESRSRPARDSHYPIVGYVLIALELMLMLYLFFCLYRRSILVDNRKILFVVVLVTAFSIASFELMVRVHSAVYFLPIAIVPVMLITFFDARTAFFASVVQIMICSLVAEYHLDFILLHLVASVLAIMTLQDLTKRSQLIRTAIIIFFGYSVTYVGLHLLTHGNITHISPRLFLYFGINSVLISFAYVLIFISERLFGFVSKMTLVELADVNNPLLRELSEKCPGTFQHSLQLSTLVTEAAREIGANTQLARAGALYHDIGKMENPAFFTENQHDVNPHELISPEQSAKIVIRHVTDGVKRAEKAKLPSVIKDFILEHHGKSTTRYFYTIACNNNGGNPVDPTPFTYPGPNPRSKETSLLMMADATEAASRSLKEFTDENVSNLVNKIVDGQIAQGLMKDSPLSFRDVEIVKRVFISILRTMYHTRVSYPDLVKKQGDTTAN